MISLSFSDSFLSSVIFLFWLVLGVCVFSARHNRKLSTTIRDEKKQEQEEQKKNN